MSQVRMVLFLLPLLAAIAFRSALCSEPRYGVLNERAKAALARVANDPRFINHLGTNTNSIPPDYVPVAHELIAKAHYVIVNPRPEEWGPIVATIDIMDENASLPMSKDADSKIVTVTTSIRSVECSAHFFFINGGQFAYALYVYGMWICGMPSPVQAFQYPEACQLSALLCSILAHPMWNSIRFVLAEQMRLHPAYLSECAVYKAAGIDYEDKVSIRRAKLPIAGNAIIFKAGGKAFYTAFYGQCLTFGKLVPIG